MTAVSWPEIVQRGARRLADPATYAILVVTSVAGTLPIALLDMITADDASTDAAVLVLTLVWAWLVTVFTFGALSMAATERPGLGRPAALLRATLARFGSFLSLALTLTGIALLVFLGLCALALVGLGGTSTAPILAVLSPVFLVVGGLGLLALIVVARLGFASVASEASSPGTALRRAWRVLRLQRSDVLLWLLIEGALVTGGVVAVVSLVAAGAALGLLIGGAFLTMGTGTELFESDIDLDAGVVAIRIFAFVLSTFVAVLVGAVFGFAAATGVALYDRIGRDALAPPPRMNLAFCDQCGALRTGTSGFCDACGAAVAVS